VLVNERLPDRHSRGEDSCELGHDLVWLRVWTGASTLAITGDRADGALVQVRDLQPVLKGRQRLLGIRFTGKRGVAEMLEGFACSRSFGEQVLVHRALRLTLAGLRVDEAPAVLDLAIRRGRLLRARALDHRRQGRLRLAQGRWHPRHPLQAGLGELLEVVGALEGTIGHEIRDPVRGLSLGSRLFDEVAERLDIVAMAAEGLHEHGNPGLRLDDQLQHDVIEVRALVATLPLGDVHDVLRGQCVAVRTTITMQTRTVEVQRGWTAAQTRGGGRRNETVEFCHPVGIEDIQGTTERIIVELVGATRGERSRKVGLFWKNLGTRERAWLINPRPLSPIALTASPAVRSRISGLCWVARSMTSPMPSSSNMPATRPRWSKTWLRYGGWSGITISFDDAEIVQDLQGHTKMTRIGKGDAKCRLQSCVPTQRSP
jgi:hypothetical protein